MPVPEGRVQSPCRAGGQSLLCVLWCPESACAAQQRAELASGEQVARGSCFRQGTPAVQGLWSQPHSALTPAGSGRSASQECCRAKKGNWGHPSPARGLVAPTDASA